MFFCGQDRSSTYHAAINRSPISRVLIVEKGVPLYLLSGFFARRPNPESESSPRLLYPDPAIPPTVPTCDSQATSIRHLPVLFSLPSW